MYWRPDIEVRRAQFEKFIQNTDWQIENCLDWLRLTHYVVLDNQASSFEISMQQIRDVRPTLVVTGRSCRAEIYFQFSLPLLGYF